MDYDLGAPNPVERHDLPRKRRRWPKVVIGLVLVVGVIVYFLPQILRTGPGKRLLVAYIQSKTGMKVWVRDFRTSWTGPTEIVDLWCSDVKTTRLGVKGLTCKASLWQLLRGDYVLGEDCRADGLHIDYVVEYGDGRDLWDMMIGKPPPSPEAKPLASRPSRPWPVVGKVRVTRGVLGVTRGQVVQAPGYPTSFEGVSATDVEGTIEFAEGGKWSCQLEGKVRGKTPDDPVGKAKFSADLNVGTYGSLADPNSRGTMRVALEQVPSGTLAWIVSPAMGPADWEQTLGPTIQNADASIAVGGGRLTFDVLRITGRSEGGQTVSIAGQPQIDLTTTPPTLHRGVAPLKLRVQMSAGLGRAYLGSVSPLLRDGVSGWVEITLDQLDMPMGRSPQPAQVAGSVATSGVSVGVDGEWYKGFAPTSFAGQWQQLSGGGERRMALELTPVRFGMSEQWILPEDHQGRLGGLGVSISGKVNPQRKLRMTATVELPADVNRELPELGGALRVPLAGSVDQPKLNIAGCELPPMAARSLNDILARHAKAQEGRHLERLRGGGRVDAELERIRAAVGLPSSRPTTMP